jgi:hypothetical protein
VLIANIIDKARYAKTIATVRLLDNGCKTYHLDFGVYPPDDKKSSASLHNHLGLPRKLETLKTDLGTNLVTTKPPIIEFKSDMLQEKSGVPDPMSPVPIVDAFDNPIRYKIPGKYLPKAVDIWSPGKNGKDEYVESAQDYDDVTNWARDY